MSSSGDEIRRAFSVAVFVRRGRELLVIHHKRLGTWLPIGGEMEPGETPLEAARRELFEETGLRAHFPALQGACDGVPAGYLGYEEHQAGSKGLHMNFVFVADAAADAQVVPNDEYSEFRWVDRDALALLSSPLNVREFGFLALDAATDVATG